MCTLVTSGGIAITSFIAQCESLPCGAQSSNELEWLVYMIGYQSSCPSKGHQGGLTVGLLKPENSRRVALMLMAWLVMLFSCVFVWKYDESYRDRYRDSPPSYSHASLCESMMTLIFCFYGLFHLGGELLNHRHTAIHSSVQQHSLAYPWHQGWSCPGWQAANEQ